MDALRNQRNIEFSLERGCRWLGWWIAATVAGYVLGGIVGWTLEVIPTLWLGYGHSKALTVLGGAGFGAIVGASQGVTLSRILHGDMALKWTLGTTFGWAFDLLWNPISGFLPGFAVTLAQWWLLRRQIRWCGWWVGSAAVANQGGWIFVHWLLIREIDLNGLVGAVAIGLVRSLPYALLTGVTLLILWLISMRENPAVQV